MTTGLQTTSPVTAAMVSSAILTGSLNSSLLSDLPKRLDNETMMILEDFCRSPALEAEHSPADYEHFLKVLRSLSLLKRRNDDDLTADLRDRLYWAKLRHLPKAAIAFIADKGLERWEWFPTIKECLDLAAEWKPPVVGDGLLRIAVKSRITAEVGARWSDLRFAILRSEMTVEQIAALPERTLHQLDNENLIRVLQTGEIRLVDMSDDDRAFHIGRIERMAV